MEEITSNKKIKKQKKMSLSKQKNVSNKKIKKQKDLISFAIYYYGKFNKSI